MIDRKLLVPYYLMSSFLYYKENKQVLTDKEFDDLCFQLDDEWTKVKHPHKKLIKRSNLKAQTGYNIKFPKIVILSAYDWYENKDVYVKKEQDGIEDLFD